MFRRTMLFVLIGGLLVCSVQAQTFTDDFETPQDYVGGDLGNYDGLLNDGTIFALDASISFPGSLYMLTGGASWDPGPGPLLYKEVTGDFIATVQVVGFAGDVNAIVEHNDAGIIARNPVSDSNENWVSMNYFPTWTAFIARSTTDSARVELGQTDGRWLGVDTFAIAEQYPWIQIERVGSDFYPRISADGVNFIPLTDPAYLGIYDPNDPNQMPLVISRPDLPDTLQVGLFDCTYTDDLGDVTFDNFSIVQTEPPAPQLTITPTAPVPGDLDIANLVGTNTDANNVGTGENPPYTNDATTYIAHDRGGQGQTFITGDNEVGYFVTGVWVQHVMYSGADPDQTWYRMQAGSQLQLRITDPNASGTDTFVLASEIYEVTGEEENALPSDTTNDQTGTGLWLNVTLGTPVWLAPNTEYGFDLTSISGLSGVTFFETNGIRDDADGGNPYADGSAYVTGAGGVADNTLNPAPGDHVFVVDLKSAPVDPGTENLVAYYALDGDANDLSGNALNGLIMGDPVFIDGAVGQALELDGVDDYVEMGNDPNFFDLADALTLSAWVRPLDIGNGQDNPYLGKGDKSFAIKGFRNGNVVEFFIYDDTWYTAHADVGADFNGEWHHAAGTYDGQQLKIYIDGELQAVTDHEGSIALSESAINIGKNSDKADRFYQGAIDEARIYNQALSDAEVLFLSNYRLTQPRLYCQFVKSNFAGRGHMLCRQSYCFDI